MQAFICPECGQASAFDPRIESALCPFCGFQPPLDERRGHYLGDMRRQRYRPFLVELLSHWDGTYTPDLGFSLPTPGEMQEFFTLYRRSLSSELYPRPARGQVLAFMAGYVHLRRGEYEEGGRHFRLLTTIAPQFCDAWVWLTVTTDDPATRQEHLEVALRIEPDHPLAGNALAIVRGDIPPPDLREDEKVVLAKCPRCGGDLQSEPGAAEVKCPYCGAEVSPSQVDRPVGEISPVEQLRLRRLNQSQPWAEVQRTTTCQVCGAESTVPAQPVERCAFCGARDLRVGDEPPDLERPDGVLPFSLDKRQALDAIHALQQPGLRGIRRWWLAWASQELGCRYFPTGVTATLGNLKLWWAARRFRVACIVGTYMPFWVFDGVVALCWAFGDGVVFPDVTEDREVKDLLFPGVDVPDSALLQRLYPFDLRGWQGYDPQLLEDWPVRVQDREAEPLADRARDLMQGLAKLQARGEPTSAEPEARGRPPLFWTRDITYRLVLLPVWVAQMERRGKHLLALVNGQSGKVAFGRSAGQEAQSSNASAATGAMTEMDHPMGRHDPQG